MKFKSNSASVTQKKQSILSIISKEGSTSSKGTGNEESRTSKSSIFSGLRQKSHTGTSTGDSSRIFDLEEETIQTENSNEDIQNDLEVSIDQASPSRKLSVIKEEESTFLESSAFNLIRDGLSVKEVHEVPSTVEDTMITNAVVQQEKMKCICKPCHTYSSNLRSSYSKKRTESDVECGDDHDSFYSDTFSENVYMEINENETEYVLLHVTTLNPSNKLLELKYAKDKTFEEFAFKWNFLRYPEMLFFNELYYDQYFSLNYQRLYVFHMTPAVYRYFKKCTIPLELYVKYEQEKYKMIGRADLNLSDSLKHPDKTLQSSMEINNKLLRICGHHTPITNYGELICKYTLGGNMRKIEAAKIKTPRPEKIPIKGNGEYTRALNGSFKPDIDTANLNLDEVELKAFQTGLNLILIRNAALRTTQEEISTELEERVDWMHQELLWKLTLQENAILEGADPTLVRWRQWKDEGNAYVKYRPKGNEAFIRNPKAEFEISIVELQINPLSRVLLDENIVQLYVEYSFLNYSGINLETPCKIKPDSDNPINYNFKKNFIIEKSDKSAKVLADMIKNNEAITFTVVSEPLPNTSICQTCVDLGSCQMGMFDLVQNSTDSLSKYFTLYDHWDEAELGKLKIVVTGIYSLRSLALHILTPETFSIIR